MSAPIRGRPIPISDADALEALSPYWPESSELASIDLSQLEGSDEAESFRAETCKRIDREIDRLKTGPLKRVPRLAVFAIAPMSLLAYLGASIGDKIPTLLFQRHRGLEVGAWRW